MNDPATVAALRDLVDRYADAVDRRDPDGIRAVFTPSAVLRVGPDGGPDEQEWSGDDLGRLLDTVANYEATFHHVGGAVFEPAEGGAWGGRVRCAAHHYDRTPNGPVDLVMFVRYDDFYARFDGGWRIEQRRATVLWTELHAAHPRRRFR